jgi:hypothetical protein
VVFRDEVTDAAVVPIQFMEPDRSARRREDDVARLIAAVEEVENRDWLDNFEKPARRKLARRGLEEDETRLDDEMRMVFMQLKLALPPEFRKQVGQLERQPGETLDFVFKERIEGFYNPMHCFTAAEALALVNDSKTITDYFGEPAKQALGRVFPSFEKDGAVPLRALHSVAVVAALRAARKGQLNVLALEGNPGIGKTTAVRQRLMESAGDGYLFLYVSPRVVINKDVTEKFARSDGNATGIMTVTTSAMLIRNAAVGFGEMVVQKGGTPRRIDSAAVVDGVDGLVFPEATSTWFLTPDQEEQLEHMFGGQRFRKESLNERENLIRESQLPGVLRTLASGTATLLKANSAVNRVVLTAAMQGYRETLRGTTINGLTDLFDKTKASSRSGMAKRLEFADHIPNVVVMIDEVAGDRAGALFVHDIARWLDDEFLTPFENVPGGSPFKVTLIVSDASLGNETVLDSYLNAGVRAPDKVLVSKSAGNRPFLLAATHVQLGSQRPLVLHVMTNSFPASRLEAEYLIRLKRRLTSSPRYPDSTSSRPSWRWPSSSTAAVASTRTR